MISSTGRLSIHIPVRDEPKTCKQALKEKVSRLCRALFCCECRKSAPIYDIEENIPLSPIARTVTEVCSPKRIARVVTRPITPPPPVEISRLNNTNSTVTEVPREGWEEISNSAAMWSHLADNKWSALKERRYQEYSFQTIFENSKYICDTISFLIKTPPAGYPEGSEAWDTVLACKDNEETLHSIALYDKANNKLAYIATHPNNVHHNMNQKQVHGAATQIILHLAQLTLTAKSTLRLKSVESAQPFYAERLKFQPDFQNDNESDRVWGISAMMLTATKIQALMERKIAPYDQLIKLLPQ